MFEEPHCGHRIRAAEISGISRLPLDHKVLGLFEIAVLHHYFGIRLRTRHEADLLQRRFIMNVGLQPCIVETSF